MNSIIKINKKLISILLFLILVSFSSIHASGWYEDFDDGNIDWPSGWKSHSSSGSISDGWYSDGRITFENSSILNDNVCSVSCVARIESVDGSIPLLYIWGPTYWVNLKISPYSSTQFKLALFGSSGESIFDYGTYCIDLILNGSSCSYYVNGKFQGSTWSRNSRLKYLIYCAYTDVKFDDVSYTDSACSTCPRKALFPELSSDKEVYLPGDIAQLTATVLDEKENPVTECIINETINYPDGTQSNVLEWTDNNDGTYTSSLELPQSGEYMVGVIVSKVGYKDGEASTEFAVLDAQEIAERYAPYMYFYEGIWGDEEYFPTYVDGTIVSSSLKKLENGGVITISENVTEELISQYTTDEYYIDIAPDGPTIWDYFAQLSKRHRTLYAYVAPDEYKGKKYLVVQYWFHYFYNDYVNTHEGEWEMIEVLLDYDKFQENGLATIPVGAAYAGHHGGEYRVWNPDLIKIEEETHPVVYVARGSHAAYFDKGIYGWQPGGVFDVVSGSGEPEKPTDVIAIKDELWLEFGGHWGYTEQGGWGDDGPFGPKYNAEGEKWYEPADWGLTRKYVGEIETSRFILALHCPADMFITNSEGYITGIKDGEFIQEIPDSYVNSIGEEEIYLVLANDTYTVKIHGTGDGEFNFIPEFSSWDESRVFGFTDTLVTSNTIAYSEIDPNMTEYTLEIDYDGDNVIDETVTPNIGLSLSSPNAIQPLKLNTTLNYDIEIKNEGDQENTFNLEYDLPNGWTGTLSQDIVTLGPKETKSITFLVNVPDVEIKDYEMRITAFSDNGLNAFITLMASAKPELTISNLSMAYNENEVILSCDASNLGLLDAENIKVQFYNGKPENNNLIGEQTISLASEETKNVSVSWITEDGIYNIYAVIDPDNTMEETSEYNNTIFKTFTIDRTPPEANIKFNTETEDIEVIGVDNIDEDVDVSYEEYTEKFTGEDETEDDLDEFFEDMETEFKKRGFRTYRIYTLEDDSGNTLKMKMLYLKLRKVIYTKVVELNYNGELKTPQKNSFSIVSIYWRGELKNLVQHLRIDREFVNVVYNARRDESIITTKGGIERREGVMLVVMKTKEGNLSYILG